MADMDCREVIPSEEYADFIIEYSSTVENVLEKYQGFCVGTIGDKYLGVYKPLSTVMPITISEHSYSAIPKLYGLMDSTAVDATGAIRLQNQTGFSLTGKGVIIGFIDTGIDYEHQAFRYATGQSRIVGIWDQTDQTGKLPPGLLYGSEYTQEDINRALESDDPKSIVPHTDEIGHGTFMAGVASGSVDEENSFVGAAPNSVIAMVKLKQAKSYLREFYFVEEGVNAYQENDIMFGVKYLGNLARRLEMPVVIVIGMGTSFGDHAGGSPLAQYLDDIGQAIGSCVVTCAGNEGNAKHHYRGVLLETEEFQDMEIRVGENETGFSLEIWGTTPDIFSVSLISPTGEVVPRIPARIGLSDVLTFLLEDTVVYVDYGIVESGSGAELISLRFDRPTTGIWVVRVYGTNILLGIFDAWLPISDFIREETYFLKPDPNVTITEPSTVNNTITVTAYNNTTGAAYIDAGRGFTRTGVIKPELTAPGVNVFGPEASERSNNGYTRKTGTSVAAALTSGACAQFLEWGIVRGNEPYMKTIYIKNYLIRGAVRSANNMYPNRQWGYGILDAYDAFRILTRT